MKINPHFFQFSTQFFRFGIVGLLNTATHIAVAALLLGLDDGMNHPVRANFIAFLIATVVGYVLNTLWSFSTRMSHTVLVRYVTVASVGAGLSAVLSVIAEMRGVHPWLGVVATVLVVPIVSYVLHQRWTYKTCNRINLPPIFLSILSLSVLGALVLVWHGSALQGYWRWDDGLHLLRATQYNLSNIFTDTAIMRHASGNQIAPFNLAIYMINQKLFGLAPVWFYAQHLLILWFASVMFWRVLSLWLHPLAALLGASLMLLGLPTNQIAQQLMTGHYVLGLLATCAMLWAFMYARLEWILRPWLAWIYSLLAALAYAVACLSKEIYVPIILLLPFLPLLSPLSSPVSSSFNEKLRSWLIAVPLVLVALAYTGLRWYTFQGVGGYHAGELNRQAWGAGVGVVTTLLGTGWMGTIACASVLVAGVGVVWQAPRTRIPLLFALLAVVGAPLVFLAIANPDWGQHARYLFVPWLLVCVLWATWLSARLTIFKVGIFLVFVGMVYPVVQARLEQDRQTHALFDGFSRYIVESHAEHSFVPPIVNAPGYFPAILSAVNAVYRSGYGLHTHEVNPINKINIIYPKRLEDIPANAMAWYAPCACLVEWSILPLAQKVDYFQQRQMGFVLERFGNPSAQAMADDVDGEIKVVHRDANNMELEGWIPSTPVGVVALWLKPPSQSVSKIQFQWVPGRENPRETNFKLAYSSDVGTYSPDSTAIPCLIVQSQKSGEEHLFQLIRWANPTNHAYCSQLLTPVKRK